MNKSSAIPSDPTDPPGQGTRPRRRGGQPGNVNRLKHGFYSRRLPRRITAPANVRTGSDVEFEIALARVRLVQLIEEQKSAPRRDWLTYERGVFNYLSLIVSMIDASVRRKKREPDLQRLLESLRLGDSLPAPHDE